MWGASIVPNIKEQFPLLFVRGQHYSQVKE